MKNNINYNNDFPNFEDFISSFNKSEESAQNSQFESNYNNEFNKQNSPFNNIDMNTILKFKQIMDNINSNKDDPRSNLLLSLKPYLKQSRKDKVDQYIQLFNMSNVIENLKPMGGEK